MKTVCICGGGSLGHVLAGWLSAHHYARVNILTNRPNKWTHTIEIDTPDGKLLKGHIDVVSDKPDQTVLSADIVILCLPGFLIREELETIKPYLSSNTFVGCVFSSTGFFFEAKSILDERQPLWGFQRVPFISRVEEYGKKGTFVRL